MCRLSDPPPRRSMDRTELCGSSDVGSIPTEGTNKLKADKLSAFNFGRRVLKLAQKYGPLFAY